MGAGGEHGWQVTQGGANRPTNSLASKPPPKPKDPESASKPVIDLCHANCTGTG